MKNIKNNLQQFLEHRAYQLRVASLRMTSQAGSGHPTSCLSAADLVAAIFLYAMHFDPHHFNNPDNDRFILSKGHAAPLLYAIWQQLGVITPEQLMTYRHFNSNLEGHPTPRFAYADVATGSLGMGLSYGAGMCLAARMDQRNFYTYVLMGDAEVAEGSIWEAAEIAAHYQLSNLVGILDCNRLGQSTESLNDHDVQHYANQFQAFGWHTIIIDGHDMAAIMQALEKAREPRTQPTMIVAKTRKGQGVALFQDKENFHGKALNAQDLEIALQQLAAAYPDAKQAVDYTWNAKLPTITSHSKPQRPSLVEQPIYKVGQLLATRKAYGQSLAFLGRQIPNIVSLDAEVKNSTFAELFEQKFPERFVQCYVAEQNMVSMAVGMQRRGKMPFVSTFAAFFSRAYDQIRMAAIGRCPLRLVGSHAGVSIGQDGPSQMGLEDIALMRAVPNSIVLYPCDAVSTYKVVNLMTQYQDGISYLRTTRGETPVIYKDSDTFKVGGCHLLRSSQHDVVCIVAAGITLFEALKAYDQLHAEGIQVAVIDAYCIKPLDEVTIQKVAQQSGKRVITVEDHYLQGGLGQAVAYALRNHDVAIDCLAVTQIPHSGKPEELLSWAGIDAAAIIKKVKKP